METIVYIEFAERVTTTIATLSGPYLENLDDNWLPYASPNTTTVNFEMIGDKIMKVEWPADTLQYGRRFKLEIPESLGFVDDNNQNMGASSPGEALTYYFMSTKNEVPHLAFNEHVPNVTSHSDYEQTVTMELYDPYYTPPRGYLEGIECDNESVLVLRDDGTTNIEEIAFVADSIGGSEQYPFAPGDSSVDKHNFYKYPGKYVFTYRVMDPEEPGNPADLADPHWSNTITRTYIVTSEVNDLFLADGEFGSTALDKHRPEIMMSADDVVEILSESADAAQHNSNIRAALESRLKQRHQANRAGADGQLELLVIKYDFSSLDSAMDTLFTDGFVGAIPYEVEGEAVSGMVFVQIDPPLDVCTIVTANEYYLVDAEDYLWDDLMPYFSPYLARRGLSVPADTPVSWSIQGSVNPQLAYDYQMLTICAYDIFGISGLELTKQVWVSVAQEEMLPNQFKKRKDTEYDDQFWAKVRLRIMQMKPGGSVIVDLERKYADVPNFVLRTLSEQEDVTLILNMANKSRFSLHSSQINPVEISQDSNGSSFHFFCEDVENLDVNRDARNEEIQQFAIYGGRTLAFAVPVQIPLSAGLQDNEQWTLYRFDATALEYELVAEFGPESVEDHILTFDLQLIDKESVYVIR